MCVFQRNDIGVKRKKNKMCGWHLETGNQGCSAKSEKKSVWLSNLRQLVVISKIGTLKNREDMTVVILKTLKRLVTGIKNEGLCCTVIVD